MKTVNVHETYVGIILSFPSLAAYPEFKAAKHTWEVLDILKGIIAAFATGPGGSSTQAGRSAYFCLNHLYFREPLDLPEFLKDWDEPHTRAWQAWAMHPFYL